MTEPQGDPRWEDMQWTDADFQNLIEADDDARIIPHPRGEPPQDRRWDLSEAWTEEDQVWRRRWGRRGAIVRRSEQGWLVRTYTLGDDRRAVGEAQVVGTYHDLPNAKLAADIGLNVPRI